MLLPHRQQWNWFLTALKNLPFQFPYYYGSYLSFSKKNLLKFVCRASWLQFQLAIFNGWPKEWLVLAVRLQNVLLFFKVPFQPETLCMVAKNGRVYHRGPPRQGGVGLVASKLAIQLSKNFEFADNQGTAIAYIHNGRRIELDGETEKTLNTVPHYEGEGNWVIYKRLQILRFSFFFFAIETALFTYSTGSCYW